MFKSYLWSAGAGGVRACSVAFTLAFVSFVIEGQSNIFSKTNKENEKRNGEIKTWGGVKVREEACNLIWADEQRRTEFLFGMNAMICPPWRVEPEKQIGERKDSNNYHT